MGSPQVGIESLSSETALAARTMCGWPADAPSPHSHPAPLQLLTCTEDMLAQRVTFLRDHGLSAEEIRRAVLAHPQVLRGVPNRAAAATTSSVLARRAHPSIRAAQQHP